MLAVVIAGLTALAFLAGDGGGDADGGNATPTPPTGGQGPTTTGARGFPPAGEESVCAVVSHEEAERLVGRTLEHRAIEPTIGQCAWPRDAGTPLDAFLFFVVKEQAAPDLLTVLEGTWSPDEYTFEGVDGLGDQAYLVVRRADPESGRPEFVEGLDVYEGDHHVLFGNGGAPVWDGPQDEIRARLRETMEVVLDRLRGHLQ